MSNKSISDMHFSLFFFLYSDAFINQKKAKLAY